MFLGAFRFTASFVATDKRTHLVAILTHRGGGGGRGGVVPHGVSTLGWVVLSPHSAKTDIHLGGTLGEKFEETRSVPSIDRTMGQFGPREQHKEKIAKSRLGATHMCTSTKFYLLSLPDTA